MATLTTRSTVDPNATNLPNDGTWRWTTGDRFQLDTGPHTLHVWQRECGAGSTSWR